MYVVVVFLIGFMTFVLTEQTFTNTKFSKHKSSEPDCELENDVDFVVYCWTTRNIGTLVDQMSKVKLNVKKEPICRARKSRHQWFSCLYFNLTIYRTTINIQKLSKNMQIVWWNVYKMIFFLLPSGVCPF